MDIKYVTSLSINIIYIIPLSEIVTNFFDNLKNISKGNAHLTYNIIGYRETNILKVDILINKNKVDVLSFVSHASKAHSIAKEICYHTKNTINKQQYPITIQASIGRKIIARESLSALRKEVTSKCYG